MGRHFGRECGGSKSEKKVVRVESEETQDYVRESSGGSRRNKLRAKRAQHSTRTYVLVRSDKALRFWQFASVVVDDLKGSYTVNLCQQCYNEELTAQGLAPLKFKQGMWEYFSLARAKVKTFIKDVEKKAGRFKANGNESLLPKNFWNKK